MYGVIFDMDGVLIDSGQAHFESWRDMAREIGRDLTRAEFNKTFGMQNRNIIPTLFDIRDDAEIERLGARKEELFREIIRDKVPVMAGAVELVNALHAAGFKLAVGTSGPAANVNAVLAGMGLAETFHAKITSEQVSRGKPDPQVFRLAAEALGLPPHQCAVVEDAPHGVQAALAAGSVAIALRGEEHSAESVAEAHLVVEALSELTPERIATLIGQHA
jgi:beta-phosphoglucomutase